MRSASLDPETLDNGIPVTQRVCNLVNSSFSLAVKERAEEFMAFRKAPKEQIFGELCFCLLTANTSAEMGIRTQSSIGTDGFLNLEEKELRDALKHVKYRFYNLRSHFITGARWIIDELPSLINSSDMVSVRDYLVENVKGIGYKEASHFLRNVGTFDFAILDKHILRMLKQEFPKLEPRATTRKHYLAAEEHIVKMAEEMGLRPGILDLYMWKLATGKLIK